jgi:hypothetical protein
LSDESHWNIDRFRSLGLVTTSVGCLDGLEVELRALLDESGVPEFEWKKLDGAKERFAAQKMCSFAVEKGCAGLLRVDVLVWDIEDSRHKIANRDDVANLHRMYYHLFRNVLRARWPDSAVWRLHPDQHSAMDWATVQDCLECVAVGFEAERSLLNQGKVHISLRREFGLEEISPASSGEHPLLQLADLFAGLAVFSRGKFQEYGAWLPTADGQFRLIEDVDPPSTSSHRSQERFRVLRCFDRLCKDRKLSVSLQSCHGLYTFNPDNPLNFWLYQPQHPFDVAPRKAQR